VLVTLKSTIYRSVGSWITEQQECMMTSVMMLSCAVAEQ